ncbi:MAG: hypothetical protein NTW52_02185 [Planctomycetota bacterium]|nr:hypothetical protein [Planctomycetota bacterium]
MSNQRTSKRSHLWPRHVTVGLISGFLALHVGAQAALSQDSSKRSQLKTANAFRVDADIYSDVKKQPIKHTLTLFSESVYYDFEDGDSGRVTVIDVGRNRIVLLDRERKVKSFVSTEEIQLTIANARVQADAKLSAATLKDFQNLPSGETVAVVSNDSIEYRSTLASPTTPDMSAQYAEFANWSARLNSIYAPMPPYLRLDLNELIASRKMMPKEITRITRKGLRQNQLISRLRVIDRLSEDDRSKIARVGAMMAEFREVSVGEYWHQPAVVSASATEAK